MKDFDHTLQRREGGQMSVGVNAHSLRFTITGPVTPNEKEAIGGLVSLAAALKRGVQGSSVQSEGEALSLAIQTPNGRDDALAMVAVNSLEAHGAISIGESQRFQTALHTSAQQAQKAAEPVAQDISDIQKAVAAIGNSMRTIVAPSESSVVAAQNLPGKSEGKILG